VVHALNPSEASGSRATEAQSMKGFWYVYVLISLRDQRFYVGKTRDLDRRFRDHASGKSPSTAPRRPVKLIYFEGHANEQDAGRRERYFKIGKGKTTLRQLLRESLKADT